MTHAKPTRMSEMCHRGLVKNSDIRGGCPGWTGPYLYLKFLGALGWAPVSNEISDKEFSHSH